MKIIFTAMATVSLLVAGTGVAWADSMPPQQYACNAIAGGHTGPNLLYDLKRVYGITTDQAWGYVKAATSPTPNYLGVSDLCYRLYPADMARRGY